MFFNHLMTHKTYISVVEKKHEWVLKSFWPDQDEILK